MKKVSDFFKYSLYSLTLAGIILTSGCSDDEEAPGEEDDLEVITDVTLIFTNVDDASDIVEASAKDPDDAGVDEIEVLEGITLSANTTYELTFEILNALADDEDEKNIGAEIEEDDDEHQFFFAFTDGAFSSPEGTGNIGGNSEIDYRDEDDNGNPVGLVSRWTTAGALSGGEFTARLQHQDDGQKTATSDYNAGEPDFILTFVLNIEE